LEIIDPFAFHECSVRSHQPLKHRVHHAAAFTGFTGRRRSDAMLEVLNRKPID
jgi:hypothetical protein